MTLRDLTVDIDFGEVNISQLLAVDQAIDEIEDSLQSLGGDITQTATNMQLMSLLAGGALDSISVNAQQTEDALEDLNDARIEIDGLSQTVAALQATELAASVALASMERDLNAVTAELQQVQRNAVGVGASSGVMAALFNTSMSTMGMTMIMFGGKVTAVAALVVMAFGAIVAAGAPLLMFTMGLVSSLGAAALAAGGLAAVAIPTFSKMAKGMEEIDKLQEKIADASTAKERLAAEKELAAVWEGMSDSQAKATKGFMEFKDFFSEFAAGFEAPIFDIFLSGLTLVKSLLTGMAPTITNVIDVIGEMMNSLNQTIAGGGFTQFFDWLATNGAESLRSFAVIGGNLLAGFFSILQTFAPIGAGIEESLLSLTERFQAWAAGLGESNGFTTFIEYAKTNTPILIGFLKETWDAILALVEAFAPMGSTVLEALGTIMAKLGEFAPTLGTAMDSLMVFAGLLVTKFNEFKPAIDAIIDAAISFGSAVIEHWTPISETLIALGAGVAAFALIMGGLSIIGTVTKAMQLWTAGQKAAALAQLGLNAAMLLSPITWVVVGIAALIAIGVLLYRNWDVIKAKAGELWATMQEKWSAIKTKTSETWDGVKVTISAAMSAAKTAVSNFFSPLLSFISNAKDKWDSFIGAVKNFKMPSFKMPSIGGMVGKLFDGSHANGLDYVPFDGYIAELHKGEKILTADEAKQARRTGSISGGQPDIAKPAGNSAGGAAVSFAPVITVHASNKDDGQSIADQVNAAVEEQMAKFWQKMNLQEV